MRRVRLLLAACMVWAGVGLAGEVRGASQAPLRLKEAAQMGFRRVVLPAGNCSPADAPDGCELVGVRSVTEALDELISPK